jgi:hypothetical protein
MKTNKSSEFLELKELDKYFMHECKHKSIVNKWETFMENLFDQDVTEDGKLRQYLNELYENEILEAIQYGNELKNSVTVSTVSEKRKIIESNMSGNSVFLTELSNGNLLFKVDDIGKEEIKDLQNKGLIENEILSELLENYFGNGYQNLTGVIGMTESFIIGKDWEITDDGNYEETSQSKSWWLPNYMVVDYIKQLLKTGQIIFTIASQS